MTPRQRILRSVHREDAVDVKKWLTIGLTLGVVANVLDAVVQGTVLAGYYAGPPFSQENRIAWLVVGDFIAALVFAWIYLRLAPRTPAGAAGGAIFGLYAGVLVNFPKNIFLHLLIQGFPYALSWIWTFYGIVWYVILGAIAGAMNRK
jgi:hypothetical protein